MRHSNSGNNLASLHSTVAKTTFYSHLLLCCGVVTFIISPITTWANTSSNSPAYSEAVTALSLQAHDGSIGAMLKLAQLYENSESDTFSIEESFKWYLAAAESGHAQAQRSVGAMYELGRGTPVDYEQAAHWYDKSAVQGSARAQTNLGYLYKNGLGVEQNLSRAFSLFTEAANQGYARGQVYLGEMFQEGRVVSTDFEAARKWYSEAALQGYSRGQLRLGLLFEKGLGVDQNYQTAVHWYKKAANQGFKPAQLQLEKLQNLLANNSQDTTSNPNRSRILVPPEYVARANELAKYELGRLAKEPPAPSTPQPEFFPSIMQMECSDFNVHYFDREILAVEAEIKNDDPGLKFESGYSFHDGDVDNDRQSVFAGLSWDLFNDGLLENKSQSRRFEYQREIEEIRAEQLRHKDLFKCRDTFLFYSFNSVKNAIQQRKKEVLSQLYELSRKAYFLGDILADDLLKVEYEAKKTDTILNKYTIQNQQIVSEQHNLLPQLPEILAPDLPSLIHAVETDSTYQKIAQLSEAILEEQYNPLYEKRLRFFVKTGVNENQGNLSSGDISSGIYFSTPLIRKKQDVLPYKIGRIKALLKKEQEDIIKEAARLHNAYGEKLTDAEKLFFQQQTVAERLRRSLYISQNRKNTTGTYGFDEHILVLRHLDELLDNRFEYIAVQESLYRQLLHLFTLTQTDWRQEFIAQVGLGSKMKRGRTGNRAIYIWANEFQKYDNKLIEQVFLAKGLDKAVISASKNIDRQKLDHFIELAKFNGIRTELMLSENSWVLPEKWPTVQLAVEELCKFGQPIHLDIEPHTLPDYQDKKQEYNTYFFEMIRKIRVITDEHSIELNIALPVLHNSDFVDAIASLSDHIYIMAYGKLNQEKLKDKIAPFSNIDKDKLVLALRPKDFTNELEQEEFIDVTFEQAGLTNFALHDFAQFIQMAGNNSL
nr:sel1 repeat family protein [Desulfobulbaceae bacterium]